jgi:hypothetical protein
VLFKEFWWDLHQVIFNRCWSVLCALSFECSDVAIEDPFGNVDVIGCYQTILDYVLSEYMFEVLYGRASDDMV